MKYCAHCDQVKTFEAFAKDKRNCDGLDGRCQDCRDTVNRRDNRVSGVMQAMLGARSPYALKKTARLVIRQAAKDVLMITDYAMHEAGLG